MGRKTISDIVEVTNHAIDRYKERVVGDLQRFERDDFVIRGIILKSFGRAYIDNKRFKGDFNLLVEFLDLNDVDSFGVYYLTIKKDIFGTYRYAAVTVKNLVNWD